MISLDEEFIGAAADGIIVHGLKVCAGVLCRLSNHHMVAAHYSSIASPEEILTGCAYLMTHYVIAPVTVTEMYLIANLHEWQTTRHDKYADTHKLVADLKTMFKFSSPVSVSDTPILGRSVDIKIDATPAILYRPTPDPDPTNPAPTNDVKIVRTQPGSKTPVVVNMGGAFLHKLPTNPAPFQAFDSSHFVKV